MGLGGTESRPEGLEHSQDIRLLCRAVFKQRNGSAWLAFQGISQGWWFMPIIPVLERLI